jgi:hypothetical protein|tara:strand:+ start:21018 stop:21257 length:240 start_codon:yes stop_codon:yes gene_type:complete
MKSFKDIWEVAANSVAGSGVSLPADAVKKKKDVQRRYDGRTKEGKKFVERMMAKRSARLEKAKKLEAKRNQETITANKE